MTSKVLLGESKRMQECQFEVEGGTLRGVRWGRGTGEGKPVLALHGWLDNCASFDFLAPHLLDVDMVALDLPGHGRSDHRKDLGAYNIWQDIPAIYQVVQQLGWTRFAVIGHSRGAMVSTVFAGTFPEKVSRLCLIEALLPLPIKAEAAPNQLATSVTSLVENASRTKNYYDSFEQAVIARAQGHVPVNREDAEVLARRGVMKNENGYFWNYDQKLSLPSEVKFTLEQTTAFLDAAPSPIKVFVAQQGLLNDKEMFDQWQEYKHKLDVEYLDGGHHFHMSQQAKHIARSINTFLHEGISLEKE